ncbi:MAG: cobaltochelatase subunit CobN [Pyrinomonadaceae bacterium]
MKVVACYVGSSLLAPLKNAEREISRRYQLPLEVAAYNFGSPLSDREWTAVEEKLATANLVFVFHVMDGENASRLIQALHRYRDRYAAVVVINCMPDLMLLTQMGDLDIAALAGRTTSSRQPKGLAMLSSVGSWMARHTRKNGTKARRDHGKYLQLADRLPGVVRFLPTAGVLTDAKHYLYIFCYFLQPSPANIQSMLLYTIKHYGGDAGFGNRRVRIPPPERMLSVAIYHPDAAALFETYSLYKKWYKKYRVTDPARQCLEPENTIGLLLMRPQVVSKTTKHYDELIRSLEKEGLDVIPAVATLMDNRDAAGKFFVSQSGDNNQSRVSQILSLTGFSFVGGPAMNDSEAAARFLSDLNVPYRSAISLDMQTVEMWRASQTGLNPIQAGMQIAIPEIDGATEPLIFGGISARGTEPKPLDDRCTRLAKRVRRWNRLQTTPREQLKLAFVLFCFPPNKGNIGTAADLDVFPSLWDVLAKLHDEGYRVSLPTSAHHLRELVLGGNSNHFGAAANVAYRMKVGEYRALCPFVRDVEKDWGTAPGAINSFSGDLLVQGIALDNIFIGVQPTFGYEGDPMRLMMARSGAPHHGFVAFYTYLNHILNVDAVIHVGTHGSLEFMPGKQIGLSGECWPDRLIGELPNLYLYSVNNPSEGSVAKRRSYAELISYLTPPISNAGLYKELGTLKDLIMSYRQSTDERERESIFESIASLSATSNFWSAAPK